MVDDLVGCEVVSATEERIRVRSVLGRFLEHSRVFVFHAGDTSHYLMGSADLMARNLDHRIEVVVPVEAPHVQTEIESIFKALLADNTQAWEMRSDGHYERLKPARGTARSAQMELLAELAAPRAVEEAPEKTRKLKRKRKA